MERILSCLNKPADNVFKRNGDELIDVLRHGQGVLNILPMDSVRDQVDKQIVLLHPIDESIDDEISRAV